MSGRSDSTSQDGRSPLQVAQAALAQGRGASGDLEAYVEFGRTVTVKVFAGEVESVTVATPRGLGVRSVREGRTGYAFTSDLSDGGLRRVVESAVENMKAADPDPHALLPQSAEGYPMLSGLWSPAVSATSLEHKIDMALAAEAAASEQAEIETVEESVYSDEAAQLAIASTTGIEAECEQSYSWMYVMAHAGKEGDRQSGLGFSAGRGPEDLDAGAAGREAAEKAVALLGARPCPTGAYTVVLSHDVTAAVISSVARALSADAVQKGRSVFAAKLGERVGSHLLHIDDDGLAEGGMVTMPFDGEGVPQQTTRLLEAGVLRSFLHSSYTAGKAGGSARSTGNARRGTYRALPGVGATNLVIRPGEGSLSQLLERVSEGLYVDSVAGLNSGVNAISGEISLGATGRLVKGGALGAAVREVTIATEFGRLLEGVVDIGGEGRWIPLYGSVFAVPVAVADVTVSGA